MNPNSALRAASWPALIVFAALVLLPVGRASEAAIGFGALATVVLLVCRRIDVRDRVWLPVLLLFACYWIPTLCSLAGAVEPSKTVSTVVTTLRFLPFALFCGWALRDATAWPSFVAATAAVVVLWVIDAYVQMATGFSLGGPAEAERLSGIFGAGNLKLGPTLAVLSPFVLLAARARFGLRGLALAVALLIAPILLSGSRAAWLSYALICLLVIWREVPSKRYFFAAILALAVGILGIGAIALRDSSGFGARVQRSLLALRGTEAAVDTASAGRLRIWRTAVAMTVAHPLTGVGARGFRYAYPRYAQPGDAFVHKDDGTGASKDNDLGASHAHQIVLEVLSETGLVGLACWLAGCVVAVRAWRRASVEARARARAPALALVAMCFPINTHLAFYSAWWGLLFWWMLASYCAALTARDA